jgi:transcriptional regulator with XRE-family HTH domain
VQQVPVDVSRIKPGSVLLPGLARLRHERKLSIRELALKADVAADTVWRLETLQRGANPKSRQRLARALGTTIKELRTPKEEDE